jgi:hypothetical protein
VSAATSKRHSRAPGALLLLLLVLMLVAGCCPAASAAPPQAAQASIHASFAPDRLGARTALTFSFSLGDGEADVPPPLRTMVVRLPAGLGLDLGGVATCAPARLQGGGPAACPRRSLIGRGHALLGVHAGSQSIGEEARLWAVHVPDRGGHPSFAIYGRGETPLQQHAVSTAGLSPDHTPYGSRLTVSIPPIPTLIFEPDASIVRLWLTVGARAGPRANAGAAVTLPRRCPAGGFPFAAEFSFADHSRAGATARVPCPRGS